MPAQLYDVWSAGFRQTRRMPELGRRRIQGELQAPIALRAKLLLILLYWKKIESILIES